MSSNIFKGLSILLCTCFLLFAVCGCTKETSNNGKKIEKITVWSNDAHSKSVMTELINEYNRTEGAEKGIEIGYVVYGNNYETTIEMAIASGQQPDIYKNVKKLLDSVEKGEIYPLNKMPDMEEFLNKYKDRLKSRKHIIDGDIYVVPRSLSAYGLVYNKDMFKAAGIVDENGEATPPKTWEELVDYAKILTDPENKKYGIAFPMKWEGFWPAEFYTPMYSSYGRSSYDRKADRYDFSIYKDGLELMLQIKEDGSYFPGAEGLDNDTARAQFSEGRVGMKFAASWDVGVYNDQFVAKCDWGVAPVPVMDLNGTKYYPRCEEGDSMVIASEVVKKDKDLKKVADVFKFLNSKEVQKRLYEKGMLLPADPDVIDGADMSDRKGWSEFAQIGKNSRAYPSWISLKLEGTSMNSAFSKVWIGDWTIDEAIEILNRDYNTSYEKSKELYADDLEECYRIDMSEFDMQIKE